LEEVKEPRACLSKSGGKCGDGGEQRACRCALCGLAGIGFLHVVAPWLVGTIIGAKYTSALGLIAPAGCFGVAVVTGQFSHMMLLAAHKERSCAIADLSGAAVLVGGSLVAALAGGETWFWRWLLIAPIVPWLLNRTLARRILLRCNTAEPHGQA
jgi:O-antigen/teichoic acid export membrane protein